METLAYIASAFIGISLGLIGGGGSILTVPVLVYMFGLSPVLSTSYSLFIVGITSLAGAVGHYQRGTMSIRTALLFGSSSVSTVFLTRKYLIPIIPKHLFTIAGFEVTEPVLTMVLFAALMIVASVTMIKSQSPKAESNEGITSHYIQFFILGIGVGLTTGLLGAGGGFLLIPALVLLLKLPMKVAIGTSLLIIALNSLIGFTGDLGHFQIQWPFLLTVTSIAMAGVFVGGAINKQVDARQLKTGFGWFILIMGVYIIAHEIFIK